MQQDKAACTDDELTALAKEALEQIESRQYYAGYAPTYRKEDFLLVGIGAQERVAQGTRTSYVKVAVAT